MNFFRCSARISKKDKIRNQTKMKVTRSMLYNIIVKQLKWCGQTV